MKLVWTRIALNDRQAIRSYIAQDNPIAALALDELFTEKASRLADHPVLGRPGRLSSTRELVVHQHYLMIYDLTHDQVRILRVQHTARQWPSAD